MSCRQKVRKGSEVGGGGGGSAHREKSLLMEEMLGGGGFTAGEFNEWKEGKSDKKVGIGGSKVSRESDV
jgi:hypothetical protein